MAIVSTEFVNIVESTSLTDLIYVRKNTENQYTIDALAY